MRHSAAWHLQDCDLHAYAGGELGGPLLWSVEAHLAACAPCRDRLHGCVSRTDPRLVEDGWARVDAALDAPVPGPVERLLLLLGVPDHTARLLAATPALRLSWLVAVAVTLATTAAIARFADPIVFLAAAPLLPLAGVAASFGPGIDPTYEMALVAPMQSFRLLLLRCVAVVSANTVLCGLASLAMPHVGFGAAGWFLPSLALTVLTLLLAPRFGTVAAACAVGAGWACLVVAATGALFTAAGQSGIAAAAALAAAVVARRASAFDTSTFRRIR
ncbi:zf-HC2 domain-containing protein [Dactylosporangium sp. NBC_01737]|uniref:zf-HC2 domain-containing protein n=1 Tax=Dactylosporangium sp. NBC_01737 TaxID=2975959 RepID=UPI002E10A0AA|nr:zf-HC2 domain-containing protein [Dactylosporangium sp. NBC_01737]